MCKPGYYSLNGLVPCSPCALGLYTDTIKAKQCKRCPDNKSQMIETNNMSLWHLSYTKNNLSDALKLYPTESNFWPFQQITQDIDIEFR
jgi:hypothetical protein